MPAALWWRAICRACQGFLYLVYFLYPMRRQTLLRGKNAANGLPEFLRGKRLSRPLVVTDGVIAKLGLASGLLESCKTAKMSVALYSGVQPNPTTDQVEAAYQLYKQEKCDCIIGFGGGSSIDCAKLVGVRVRRPRTPLRCMKGLVKVLWPLPYMVAVPTTAGTGSEVTVAAVVTDAKTHEKYPIEDPVLLPRCAVLDPTLTVGMPPFVTATTGMDTLTHGVEAYLNLFHVRATSDASTMCVRLVFNNLRQAYNNPHDLNARANMMEAAYLGGVAFTRAYVGNCHAIAHCLGGLYGVPHGLANAIILPYVLEHYGAAAQPKLARLARVIGCHSGTDAQKAEYFIQAVRDLNAAFGIPSKLSGTTNPAYRIQEKDIPHIARTAESEANPVYPVPVIFSTDDFVAVIRRLM